MEERRSEATSRAWNLHSARSLRQCVAGALPGAQHRPQRPPLSPSSGRRSGVVCPHSDDQRPLARRLVSSVASVRRAAAPGPTHPRRPARQAPPRARRQKSDVEAGGEGIGALDERRSKASAPQGPEPKQNLLLVSFFWPLVVAPDLVAVAQCQAFPSRHSTVPSFSRGLNRSHCSS